MYHSGTARLTIFACAMALFASVQAMATDSDTAQLVPGQFRFRTFHVPNQFVLRVENINNFGSIVGYYQVGTASSPGPLRGFDLFPYGKLQTLIDPLDVEGPNNPFGGVTEALGLNDRERTRHSDLRQRPSIHPLQFH